MFRTQSRRDWLRLMAAGVSGFSMSGWLGRLAAQAADNPARKRACILLWMNGGPSTIDLWDLKPGHANGGPFKEIQTSAPGLKISEHLPKVAKFADKMAVIRSMTTKEADHGRATFLMKTGYAPTGPIQYPSLGPIVSKELGPEDAALPNCVAIAPFRFSSPGACGSGFLGPKYAPLVVGETTFFRPNQPVDFASLLKVQDIDLPAGVEKSHAEARIDLLRAMHREFNERSPGVAPASHRTAYERAVKLMNTDAKEAFDIDKEK